MIAYKKIAARPDPSEVEARFLEETTGQFQ
jgi:hypothetical protein